MTSVAGSAVRDIDCLVIGGGLAGGMAGLRLARAGHGVLLVERERESHAKVCGEFLSPEAVRYLRAAGVDPLACGAERVHRLRLTAGRRCVETALPFSAQSVSRALLDETLLTRAKEHGCDILRGVSVESAVRDSTGWTARLSDGQSVRAGNLFLATGKHDLRGWSRPAGKHNDLVGFKMHWRLAPEQVRQLRLSIELFLFEGGYGGLSLVENDTANLAWVVRKRVLAAQGGWSGLLTRVCAQCPGVEQRLHGANPLWERPMAIAPIPYGYLARESDGAWRIGDQAAVIPSFTGDGMAIALHSASLAAEMFLAGESADLYQRALAAQLRRGMALAVVLSRLMTTPAARRLAPGLLRILPPVLRWVAAATRIPAHALSAQTLELK
ncbi:MAG TPA: FAD-dependent monooxygenase [Terracidiphilus sp.]|jgi:flavin-dependent dehydrogenase